MATVLSLVNQVLLRTGQVTVNTLANAEAPASQALDFLNTVLSELYLFLNPSWLFKSTSFATELDLSRYDLPADVEFDRLLDYTLTVSGEKSSLSQVPEEHIKVLNAASTGKPHFFWIQEDKFHLWPRPDKVYTIDFIYKAQAPKLTTSTQILDLPQAWIEALIFGVQAYLERFLGESNANDTYRLYQRQVDKLKSSNFRQQKKRMKPPYKAYRRRY